MVDLTTRAAGAEHEITIGILVVAVIAFAALAHVDIATWWSLRGQRDRTPLGRVLKAKKLAWGTVASALAVLYLLTLLDEAGWYDVGLWPRLTVRLVTITAVIAAAVIGRRFRMVYNDEMARQDRAREEG